MPEDSESRHSELPKSPKFREARESLPPTLRPVYDEMVRDYSWCTTKSFGRGYVAYAVLAEMVRMGWRSSGSSGIPNG
jgi:hypothetical protein